MFNDLSSPLALLETRRSCRPRDLTFPGPNPDQLRIILAAGLRTPDHGKLHPWRFVHVTRDSRVDFAELLQKAYLVQNSAPGRLEREANEKFAHQAPELIVVVFSPRPSSKVPLWEQELSCGAACMNLLSAAASTGFCGGWVSGWAAYNETVRDAFGVAGERIAGFIFLGTPACPLEERDRPAYDAVVSEWVSPD